MSIPKDAPGAEVLGTPKAVETDTSQGDGSYQVASLSKAISRRATKAITKEIMKPLTKPGARMADDVKIVEPTAKIEAEASGQIIDEQEVELPSNTTDFSATEEPAQPPVAKPIITDEAADETIAARQAAMDAARTAPSPTALQKEAGVEKGRINTTFYDQDELNATIQATAQNLPDISSRTIQSLYDDAHERGVATNILDQIFKGKPMTSAVGGDELATRMAALVTIHDASLVQVDAMMAKAVNGTLGVAEKVRLREALAQHQIIVEQLTTAKTDIARSMAAFKGAGDGTSKTLSMQQQQIVLDQFGGDDQMRVLAEKWMKADTAKAKNKLVEVGVLKKTIDAIIFTAQSSLLTDPNTHIFNAAGTGLMLSADSAERTAAVGYGMLRQRVMKLVGKTPNEERFTGADVASRASAVFNGLLDGWHMMADGFTQKDVQAKDVPRTALSAEYFSNTPYMKLRGEVYRTGELKGTMIGNVLDAMGMVHSVPMRFIAASDGFFGGVAQRMELHDQAQKHGLRVYFDALDADETPEQALLLAQEATGRLLSEQPADIAASVDSFRRTITLQDDIDKNTPVSNLYTGTNKLMNSRVVKMITLFNKTLMNIGNQGTARLPGFNLVSPQFWSDYQKGGKMRDLAMTRVGLGTGMLATGYWLTETGRFTGPGPVDPADRDTLTASGYMPFALRLGEGEELSAPLIEKLKKVVGEDGVTKGIGDFDGQTFISLKKLEPITMPLLMGAAIKQSLHYSDYDDNEAAAMFSAAVGATYQTASNFPQTQLVSELYRIMASQKVNEDEGSKFVRSLEQIITTYSNTVISGTPIVGLANGALSARLERYLDPGMSDTGIRAEQAEFADDTLGIDLTAPGFRAFGEAYNRLLSRTPFLSKTLPPRLDEFGEEIAPDLDTLYNFGPRMRKGIGSWEGESGELKMYLASINHGITRLPKNVTFNGVTLTSEMKHRFIQLYANDIRIDGMNMKQAIIKDANEMLDDIETLGLDFPYGEAQQRVNSIVSEYRTGARERMFGKTSIDAKYRLVNLSPVGVGTKLGLGNNRIEFPEAAQKMRMEKSMRIFEPK